MKVGPLPFVSSSGAENGLGARVVQPGGPSAPHRAAIFAIDIQPLSTVAMESPPTGIPMPLDQCIGSRLLLPVEGSTASSLEPKLNEETKQSQCTA